MRNTIITTFLALIFTYNLSAQNSGGPDCASVEAFCSDNTGQYIFNNSTNVADAGAIGCLNQTPNPAWFFIRVEQSGDLRFRIIQNSSFDSSGNPNGSDIDVDFVAWGPFRNPNGNCGNIATTCQTGNCPNNTDQPNYYVNDLDGTNIVDCSYSSAAVENFRISNAQAGEFYLLLVTNFDNNPGRIKLEQLNFGQSGAGSTDCSIIAGNLGADQTVCEGTRIDLDGTPTSGTPTGYQWALDTGSGFNTISGETSATLSITNNASGTYQVTVTDVSGNTATDEVEITFVPPPTLTPLSNADVCEGNTVNISVSDTNGGEYQWQVSTDGGTNWNNATGPNYANDTTNSLEISNTPNSFNNYQYRVNVRNAAAASGCETTSTVSTLTVNPLPTATNIPDINQCEDDTFTISTTGTNADTYQWQVSTNGGTNWNNIAAGTNYADVTTNTLQALNVPNSFNNNQYRVVMTNASATNCESISNAATLTVNPLPTATTIPPINRCENDTFTISTTGTNANTYQWQVSTDGGTNWNDVVANTNYADVTTNTLTISNVPNSFNNNQYRVLMENTAATGCNSFSNVTTLTVNPLPTSTNIPDANQCENDSFTFTTTGTNADVYQWQVSTDGGTNWNDIAASANYTDVTTNTLSISNVPNSFNNNQYRVRMSNAAVANCGSFSNAATLTVNPLPTATTIPDLTRCEDDTFTITTTGTNANTYQWQVSTDGGTNWNDIVASANYADVTTNTLSISNVPNSFNNNQYRVSVSNTSATSCNSFSNAATLTVNPLPVLNNISLNQCDDDTDGVTAFNLTEANSLVSTNSANETFDYFTDTGLTNQITNTTTYINTSSPSQTIYVRVTDNTSGCSNDTSLTLQVTTTQIPSTFTRNFSVCDDFLDTNGNNNADNDDTDGISTFDFSSADADIRALFPSTQPITVTYYENEADALAEQNPIPDIANYRNISSPNTQQIYVRVDNNLDNGCLGLGPYITLTVDPVPTATAVPDLELCDDFVDGDGTNGIVQSFDLESQTAGILDSLNPANFTVTYHLSQADATSGSGALSSPFTNTVANRQTIYVRIEGNGCYFDRYTFDVVVNSLPTANALNAPNELEVCDDDTDSSARNGFVQNIDLEAQTASILGSQDASNFTVTYHTSLALAQSGTTPITGPFSNSVAYRQTIYVRIVNNISTCVNDTFNFDVVVNREPLANPDNLLSNLSYCDDDTDTDDTNGFVQNIDLDSQIADILGDPTVQDEDDFNVTFHLSQADATAGNDPQSTPFTNTVANQQTIYVRIENKATGCVNDDLTFEVIVNPLPDFSVTTPQTLCLNNSPLTLQVENPNAVYTYQWRDPSGTDLGTGITQDVTSGGDYTITATSTDGTMCQRTLTITVNESNIATISQDDVTIVDDSNNNSITINENNLGEGDYEFALLFENGSIARDYQDFPVFEGLEGGIYTIMVRDKNGCGVASLAVAVIEFPKFFTPNNDGFNDTWVIKGANSYFFPESSVYIFNRQGKVMTQISIDGTGWNGLYKGDVAPSSDYWFQIRLVDRNGNVRAKNGHFSLLRK